MSTKASTATPSRASRLTTRSPSVPAVKPWPAPVDETPGQLPRPLSTVPASSSPSRSATSSTRAV
jgi:hypothetical protein